MILCLPHPARSPVDMGVVKVSMQPDVWSRKSLRLNSDIDKLDCGDEHTL